MFECARGQRKRQGEMERLDFKAMVLAVRGRQNPKSAGQAGDPEKR